MDDRHSRRAFITSLVASVVALGAPLPVGLKVGDAEAFITNRLADAISDAMEAEWIRGMLTLYSGSVVDVSTDCLCKITFDNPEFGEI